VHLEVDAAQNLGRAVALAQAVDRDRRLDRAGRSPGQMPAIASRASVLVVDDEQFVHGALRLGGVVACDWSRAS
jgi:hypothetical protein